MRNCYFYPINLGWKTLILAIPFPTLIGQKAWREESINNINAVIKALVVAINAERDKQNEGVRKSVNKTYTMQNLNKQIEENKSLRAENDALKTENNKVKQRISQLDENAVRRVTAQKDVVIERLNTQLASKNEDITKLKTEYNTLWKKSKILVFQWNDLTKQPEIIEAVKRVEVRKIRRQNVRNRQDKTDIKVSLTDSLVKVMNSSKSFRNQTE